MKASEFYRDSHALFVRSSRVPRPLIYLIPVFTICFFLLISPIYLSHIRDKHSHIRDKHTMYSPKITYLLRDVSFSSLSCDVWCFTDIRTRAFHRAASWRGFSGGVFQFPKNKLLSIIPSHSFLCLKRNGNSESLNLLPFKPSPLPTSLQRFPRLSYKFNRSVIFLP